MNIVKQLLRGSAEIDRMRTEIHQLVKMIFGLFPSYIVIDPPIKLSRLGSSYCWEIYTLEPGKLSVVCIVAQRLGGERVYASADNGGNIPTKHIQALYQTLPELIDGFIQAFDFLQEKLGPFLEAGKET